MAFYNYENSSYISNSLEQFRCVLHLLKLDPSLDQRLLNEFVGVSLFNYFLMILESRLVWGNLRHYALWCWGLLFLRHYWWLWIYFLAWVQKNLLRCIFERLSLIVWRRWPQIVWDNLDLCHFLLFFNYVIKFLIEVIILFLTSCSNLALLILCLKLV